MAFIKPSHQTRTGSAKFGAFGALSSLWCEGKSKSFILGILVSVIAGSLVLVFPLSAGTLSADIFPDTLDGLPLYEIMEETEMEFSYSEITEAYWVDYLAEDWSKEIVVLFWRLKDEESAQRINQGLISDMKADFSEMFDRVDWGTSQTVDINGYQAIGIDYTAYMRDEYLDGGIMSVAVREYVIVISVAKIGERPSMTEMKRALEALVKIVPGEGPGLELEVNFPETLNGVPLKSIEEEVEPSEEIAEGLSAYYESEQEHITVLFLLAKDEEAAKKIKQDTPTDLEAYYRASFERVDWGTPQIVDVKGEKASVINFKLFYGDEQADGGIMFLAIREYFIFVQILNLEGASSLSELKDVLEIFVNQVPVGVEVRGCTDSEALNYNPEATVDDGTCAYKEPETICGNGNCEFWEGESCKNCVQDCRLSGYCCFPGYSYVYAHDYHNEIYQIHEALGGVIPRGAILLPEGINEDDLPLTPPHVCDKGGMPIGECVYNYDCPSGVCTVENWCIKLRSEEFQEVKDEELIAKIYGDQTNYKEEYVDAYYEVKGAMTTQMRIREANLEVSLEVQGNVAAKVPEVNEGDEVEIRLEIENGSSYQLALTAGIFYPGKFDIEEKKYTMSFEWSGGLASLIGSFKTKLINAKFVVMPPGSKLYVYSKIVPEETGYLDVQGLIFYTTEKKYQNWAPGFLSDAPNNYQETEVSESILVKERPCDWWPICL